MATDEIRAGKVFVNYRSKDTAGVAGRVYDRLALALGKARILKDVEGGLRGGDDWPSKLQELVASADVVLALIGPRWLELLDRADYPDGEVTDDWVRRELAQAFRQGKTVIPVLIDNAAMPDADDLPEELRQLPDCHAERLQQRDGFDDGMKNLITETRHKLDEAADRRARALAQTKSKWVVWSTPESVAAGQWSVMALVETVAAVLVYWFVLRPWLGLYPLLASVLIAPLVLLRSDESVALGVKWWTRFEENWDEFDKDYKDMSLSEKRWVWLIFGSSLVLGGMASFAVSHHLAQTYLIGASGLTAFLGGALIGFIAVAGAVAGTGAGAGAAAAAVAVAVAVAAAAAVAGKKNRLYQIAPVLPVMIMFGVAMALGFFLPSLGVRMSATLVHWRDGLKALPGNFRRLLVSMSPAQTPELVPGLPQNTIFTFSTLWQVFKEADELWEKILFGTALLIWFLPAWLYRFMLKSTAWFWSPILLGEAMVRPLDKRAETPEWWWRMNRKLWRRLTFLMAGLSLLFFIGYNLLPLVWSGGLHNPLVHVLGFVFLIDWSHILPIQYLLIAIALLAVISYFWADSIYNDYDAAKKTGNDSALQSAYRQNRCLTRLYHIRITLLIAFFVLFGFQVLLYFNAQACWFPQLYPEVKWLADLLFGARGYSVPVCVG